MLEPPVSLRATTGTVEERLQALAEEARRSGHEDGLRAGQQEAARQLAPAAEALRAAALAVQDSEGAFIARAERAAVELALEIAAKVISAELSVRPEQVLEIVSGAIRSASERDHLVVQVSAEDFELVREATAALAGGLGVQRLEVVAERRVRRGGCIVRTPDGDIDAQIEEQLARVRDVIVHAREADADV